MKSVGNDMIENKFSSLSAEEKVSVISHGVALCLSEWKKRLFLAESTVRFFEEKYHISLAELDTKGLPDDADHVRCTKTISCGTTELRWLKRRKNKILQILSAPLALWNPKAIPLG